MRRSLLVLGLFLLAPFLMGHGGSAPGSGPPSTYVLSTDSVSAVIVIDTHEVGPPPVTSTAKLGSIFLTDTTRSLSQPMTVSANFVSTGTYVFGCDLTLTLERFVGTDASGGVPNPVMENRVRMSGWMDEDFMKTLFAQLGRTVGDQNIPVVTQILNSQPFPGSTDLPQPGQCIEDPRNPSATNPGWLLLRAKIQFAQPPKK